MLLVHFIVFFSPYPVKCACGKKSCPVKKFWHKQKTNGVKNSNGSMEAKMGSPTKKGLSPLKLNLSKQVSEEVSSNTALLENYRFYMNTMVELV